MKVPIVNFSCAMFIFCVNRASISVAQTKDEICFCPEPFQKVPKVPFKCVFAGYSENRQIHKAQEYCRGKGGTLIEPESNDELKKIRDYFPILNNFNRFFLGYAKKPATIACENATDGLYSISSCTKLPEKMTFAIHQPGNFKSDHCVESFVLGMNDVSCSFKNSGLIACQFIRDCPSGFEMAVGINDRCFMVNPSEGQKKRNQARRYCRKRGGILYKPKNKYEMTKLENHFKELKGKRYFVGYADKWAKFDCLSQTGDSSDPGAYNFYSITTCSKMSQKLWFEGEPQYHDKACVESGSVEGNRGLKSTSCNSASSEYIVCQFNKYCGNYSESENYGNVYNNDGIKDKIDYDNDYDNGFITIEDSVGNDKSVSGNNGDKQNNYDNDNTSQKYDEKETNHNQLIEDRICKCS